MLNELLSTYYNFLELRPLLYIYLLKPTAVVADLSIVCAVEREVRGSIPVWEYVLQGPMSEFEPGNWLV